MKMIKSVFLCFSLCLLVMVVSVRSTGDNCAVKNPFLKKLAKKGVSINAEVVKNSQGCGNEWQSNGSCCEFESLKQYALTDQKKIAKSIELTKSEFPKFVGHIKETIAIAEAYLKATPVSQQDQSVRKAALDLTGTHMKQAYSTLHNEIMLPTFSSSMDACWKKVSLARSNSLCSVCSGKSEVYFYQDKGIVSYQLCNDVLQTCTPKLRRLIQIFTKIKEVFQVYGPNYSPKDFQGMAVKVKMGLVVAFLEDFQKHHFMKAIVDYLGSDPKNNIEVTGNLCQKVVSLVQDDLLEKVSSKYNEVEDIFVTYMNHVKADTTAAQNQQPAQNEQAPQEESPADQGNWQGRRILFDLSALAGLMENNPGLQQLAVNAANNENSKASSQKKGSSDNSNKKSGNGVGKGDVTMFENIPKAQLSISSQDTASHGTGHLRRRAMPISLNEHFP